MPNTPAFPGSGQSNDKRDTPRFAPAPGFNKRSIPLDGSGALHYERALVLDQAGWQVALREDRHAVHGPVLQRAMESVIDACLLELKGIYRLQGSLRFYHLQYQAAASLMGLASEPPTIAGAQVIWGAQRLEVLLRHGQCVFARWLPMSISEQSQLIEALHLQKLPPRKFR